MAFGILALAFWLWVLAMLWRTLERRNVTIKWRRLSGAIAGSIPVISSLITLPPQSAGVPPLVIGLAVLWGVILRILSYVTLVHTPQWVTGKR